jgi:hypothetical protein
VITYALAPRAVVTRARALSAWNAAAMAAPAWLVVVLIAQLGLAPVAWLGVAAGAMAILAAARATAEYGGARRRLAAFVIEADDAGLSLRTGRGALRIAPTAIARVVEIHGPLGGLRLFLEGPDMPSRVDVPRGGEGFGDLRERIAGWRSIDRARRRNRVARVVLGLAVVAGLFFLPFVIDDVRGSKVGVAVVLVAAWLAMRLAIARS